MIHPHHHPPFSLLRIILSLFSLLLHLPSSASHPSLTSYPTSQSPLSTLLNPPLPTSPLSPSSSPPPSRALDELIRSAEDLLSARVSLPTALRRFRFASILGHEGASTTLATLLLSSDHYLRNIPSAIKALRIAVNKGQPDALALMGTLHASGLADRWGVEKNLAKALVHWEVAAGSGNVYANAALGFRYMKGLGVRKVCRKAARYYRKAAYGIATDPRYWPSGKNFEFGEAPLASSLMSVGRTRFGEEMFERGGQVRGRDRGRYEDEELFHYYRHLAEGGDVPSMTMLGSLLLTGGLGVDADIGRARVYLERGVVAGDGEAHGILGHLELKRGNWTGALMHFRWSAAKMDKIGHYGLGMVYKHALAGEQEDLSKALMHFQLAAESKHAEASFQLGMMYWRGEGVEKNFNKAFEYFKDGAKLGNIQSKLNVGSLVSEGILPAKKEDCERAVVLFKEVAEEGEWNSLFDLAVSMFDAEDWYGSLYRHLQAAHAGIELGQYNAAMILEKMGEGQIEGLEHWDRERMLIEMHELYDMSGKQNQSGSYMRSGDVAFVERKDYRTALRAYSNCADLQDPEGMFAVGMMYANGQGIAQNRTVALDQFAQVTGKGEKAAIAANLAIIGLKVYWWFCDVWEWWVKIDEEVRQKVEAGESSMATSERVEAEGAADNAGLQSAKSSRIRATNAGIGDEVALMGGLLVILIAVLVVRGKRIARLPSNGEGGGNGDHLTV